MRQHRWLDAVKDYECDILYHAGKANVVTDVWRRKAGSAPIRDLCLRMLIVSPLLDLIKKEKVEGYKKEN